VAALPPATCKVLIPYTLYRLDRNRQTNKTTDKQATHEDAARIRRTSRCRAPRPSGAWRCQRRPAPALRRQRSRTATARHARRRTRGRLGASRILRHPQVTWRARTALRRAVCCASTGNHTRGHPPATGPREQRPRPAPARTVPSEADRVTGYCRTEYPCAPGCLCARVPADGQRDDSDRNRIDTVPVTVH